MGRDWQNELRLKGCFLKRHELLRLQLVEVGEGQVFDRAFVQAFDYGDFLAILCFQNFDGAVCQSIGNQMGCFIKELQSELKAIQAMAVLSSSWKTS